MPRGINGGELAEEARKLVPNLRVLFTSGYAENPMVHQGRLNQHIHLLHKPYRRAELASKLRTILDA
jgi:DNA-binding LytR/AlgR family response regulator